MTPGRRATHPELRVQLVRRTYYGFREESATQGDAISLGLHTSPEREPDWWATHLSLIGTPISSVSAE